MSEDYLKSRKMTLRLYDGKEIVGCLGMLRAALREKYPDIADYGLDCINQVVDILQTAEITGDSL